MEQYPVLGHRRSEQIAKHVTSEISAGRFGVGDRLPSERDLALQLGVSRPLVREGYRILESLGVVDVRHGSGVYVADRKIYDANHDLIWNRTVNMLDVIEFADVISSRCGELAAVRISDEEIVALREIHERQARATKEFDLEELADIDHEFHGVIVTSARNPIVESFEQLSRRVLDRDRVLLLGTAADRSYIEHGQIIEALDSRDPVQAGTALRFHSQRSHAVMKSLLERQRRETMKGESPDSATR
ncbi:MAG: FadR/GntR family transcriptional regulator [Thermomicrobiales bacterium]